MFCVKRPTGGLGTTPDDRTMEGIARALGAGLELNPEAFEVLKEKVGARPLSNPVGAAPGPSLAILILCPLEMKKSPTQSMSLSAKPELSLAKSYYMRTFGFSRGHLHYLAPRGA